MEGPARRSVVRYNLTVRCRHSLSTTAFTLVELLVVITIIAILCALIFPVFARAKQSALESANLSNLKQLGQATFIYASDSDDYIPTWNEIAYAVTNSLPHAAEDPGAYWDSKVLQYTGGREASPESNSTFRRSGVWHSPLSETDDSKRSYGLNQMLVFEWIPGPNLRFDVDKYRWRYISLGMADTPSATVLIGDGGNEGRLSPPRNWDGWGDRYRHATRDNYRREAPWRYGERAGYVFADGHSRMVLGDVMYPSPKLGLSAVQTLGLDHCSMAANFALSRGEADWHRDIAEQNYGVSCR